MGQHQGQGSVDPHDDPYIAAVEGIGVEFRADLDELIARTRTRATATLRDLHGPRTDAAASVDYMIEVTLTEAAAAARSA
jgi:hypothetical protein